MIESIGNATSATSSQRSQSLTQTSGARSTSILTAIQQTTQKSSNAVAPVKVFAVPQTSNSGTSTTTKLPRGSLVDVLA